jgi:hypothetical protein
MDTFSVATTGIKTALAGNSSLVALVSTRIWMNEAPPELTGNFPYVLMTYAGGGLLNDAPYDALDIDVMVTGISTSMTEAETIAGYIHTALHKHNLTLPDSWVCFSTCRELDPYSKTANIQNSEFHQIGATYRIRGARN